MPDRLVIGFTLNTQSLEGSVQVTRTIVEQRTREPIRVIPVPMRVERAEKDLLDRAFALAERGFNPFLTDRSPSEREVYWQQIAFFYNPYYSFGEVLAVFGDRHRQSDSLLASAERLTGHITDGEITTAEPVSDAERSDVLAQYNPPL